MEISTRVRVCAVAILSLAALAAAHGTAASASSGAPLQKAIANTNKLLSYREDDTSRTVINGVTATETNYEIYDQRHNRERDHAHISFTKANGASTTYVVDVVMMNNHTYHRSTLEKGGWKVQSGYGYVDPASGQRWLRAPLNFTYLEHIPIELQGRTGNGTYHIRFRPKTVASTKARGVFDVWISGQGAPYIVHYSQHATAVVKGKPASQSSNTRLSGFNKPVSISAPKVGT